MDRKSLRDEGCEEKKNWDGGWENKGSVDFIISMKRNWRLYRQKPLGMKIMRREKIGEDGWKNLGSIGFIYQ